MNRREFLKSTAFAGAATLATTATAQSEEPVSTVRFLTFADLHYSTSGFWPHGDQAWLDRILQRAVDARADFVMSVGDFTFGPNDDKTKAFVRHYNEFQPVKTYHAYGNHDFESVTCEELDAVYGLPHPYYSFDRNGFRFVVLDPHNVLKDGVYHRFSKRCSYSGKEGISYTLPPEQLAWLRKTVVGSPYPCVVFAHESIERPRASIASRQAVLDIFAEANAKRRGTVRLVITGHEHKDNLRVMDDIVYLELNSATYDIGRDHAAYPAEFRKKCGSARCILTWEDPLSAVITLTSDGGMRIEGSESKFLYGIGPNRVGWGSGDTCGRVTSAKIQSVDWKLSYR